MQTQRQSAHGEWSSRMAFILAATGAAVGLGNIWKFPYVAGLHGGGIFVLIYILCVIIIGIPLLMAEIAIGRNGRQNPFYAMRTVATESGASKQWQLIGGLIILAGFLIMTYYSVIAGWTLNYIFQAASGDFTNASASQVDILFNDLMSKPWQMLLWHTIVIAGTTYVIARGVQSGIEKTVYVLFPTMLILMLLLVAYSMDTGYFGASLAYMFKPDFSAVSPHTALVAMGQAFFSLSLATGTIMMYGAYVPRNVSITRCAIIIGIADTGVALLAGVAIFPIVFANGLKASSGPGLIFKTLPIAFGHMPYGIVFATIFFIMLYLAAFTSTISLLEPTTAWMIETLRMKRHHAALLAGFLIWSLGFGTIFSFNIWSNFKIFGLNIFESIDYLTANIMMPLGGFAIAIFCAWFLQKSTALAELQYSNGKLYHAWRFVLRYITPVAIVMVFLNFIDVLKF